MVEGGAGTGIAGGGPGWGVGASAGGIGSAAGLGSPGSGIGSAAGVGSTGGAIGSAAGVGSTGGAGETAGVGSTAGATDGSAANPGWPTAAARPAGSFVDPPASFVSRGRASWDRSGGASILSSAASCSTLGWSDRGRGCDDRRGWLLSRSEGLGRTNHRLQGRRLRPGRRASVVAEQPPSPPRPRVARDLLEPTIIRCAVAFSGSISRAARASASAPASSPRSRATRDSPTAAIPLWGSASSDLAVRSARPGRGGPGRGRSRRPAAARSWAVVRGRHLVVRDPGVRSARRDLPREGEEPRRAR